MPSTLRSIVSPVLLIAVFITVSFVAREHTDFIRALLGNGGAEGAILFVLLTVAFVIFVIPLDIVFLIPIGVHLWGPLPTAFLSIIGWVVGASIAFSLARKYGEPLVRRIIGQENMTRLHQRIPTTNLFWSVGLLRMLVPVDLLSYALGLFTNMSWGSYILATAIGVTPFGFVFAYVGALPAWYQLFALSIIFALVAVVLYRLRRQSPL